MAVDLLKEIGEEKVVLLLIPSLKYTDVTMDLPSHMKGSSICYVTINKTAEALMESLKKKKVPTKNIFFVDTISKTIKQSPKQMPNVLYVSNPGALTEISIVVQKLLSHDFDFIIFDSLTNLLIYEKQAPVSKFVSSLVNKIKTTRTRAFFYALSSQKKERIIEETGLFVDKVVDLEEIGEK